MDEDDGSVDEDMETLRRACMIVGRDPAGGCYSDDESSASEDDFDLLRSIQQRCSSSSMAETPLMLKPLNVMIPTDSEDDDFETVRAIQRRFSQYDIGSAGVQSSALEKEISCHVVENGNETQFEDQSGHFSSTRFTNLRIPYCGKKFVDALRCNRVFQRFIRDKLVKIEAKIESIKNLKRRAKCLMDFEVQSRKRTGRVLFQKRDPRVKLISLPKKRLLSKLYVCQCSFHRVDQDFVNIGFPFTQARTLEPLPLNYGPDENPHVSICRKVYERFPFSSHNQRWSKAEVANLIKGIKHQYQERALSASIELFSDPGGVDEKSSVTLINNIEFSIDYIRSFLPMVDWNRIASMHLPGRSAAECESRWLNHEDPTINHNPWTADEEKKLFHITKTKGIYYWNEISMSLGTHRTPFQCLVRYQRSLNPYMLKKDWTEEEDSQLRAAVGAHGEGDWQLVASYLEGRTGQQCSIRWKNSLHPDRKKVGRWSVDEDKCLKVAVLLFGAKNWCKIAHFVPGRTQSQCRERWVNCLDPALNLKAWTEEEDTKLREAITAYGYSWSKVASFVPPRTDNQCRRRWKVLFPDDVLLHQDICKVQKALLITNFTDRRSERCLIGPRDVYTLQSDAPTGGILMEVADGGDQAENKGREVTQKRRKRKVDYINESEGTAHERETIPKKREKRLDRVTKAESKKRKRNQRSSNANLEAAPPSIAAL